ncbi:hypothetical protein AKJ57_03520 [candidate division MSBL1 archaeon SCGC-AAA259A05]|uniref:Uncharacterized protein n=1 Tax=candidate division MSBL1 archaeon SCGC-AAA259A05 TaxID=1698259 RepID=A0A133U9G1_9EURY|nr:hypothetical protein AKJ57_03520 [candidate division MSBL1 archaeon SCGC-AAA259A05]
MKEYQNCEEKGRNEFKFCPYCGKRLPDRNMETQFCPYCGERLSYGEVETQRSDSQKDLKKEDKSTFRFLGDREFFLALIGSILIIISVFLPALKFYPPNRKKEKWFRWLSILLTLSSGFRSRIWIRMDTQLGSATLSHEGGYSIGLKMNVGVK